MATKLRVQVFFENVGEGVGGSGMGQAQSQNPGFGQGAGPGTVGSGQQLYMQAAEQIVGTDGSLTLAQIQTALVAIANDLAGASGTPLITAAILAQINGWATGNP